MPFGRRTEVEDFENAALPHLDDLYRTARRFLGSKSDAEDLVQETYMHGWKSFHRFERGTNCRAWLFRILFHRLQHHRRKWSNPRIVKASEEIIEETVAYDPGVRETLSDEEVLMALENIPAEYREVILLADVMEFSYKEVAETLQIPVGTVMSRLSRGRKQLRVELAPVACAYGITDAREEGRAK